MSYTFTFSNGMVVTCDVEVTRNGTTLSGSPIELEIGDVVAISGRKIKTPQADTYLFPILLTDGFTNTQCYSTRASNLLYTHVANQWGDVIELRAGTVGFSTRRITVSRRIYGGMRGEQADVALGFLLCRKPNSLYYYTEVVTTKALGLVADRTGFQPPTLSAMGYSDAADSDPLTALGAYAQGISAPVLGFARADIVPGDDMNAAASVIVRAWDSAGKRLVSVKSSAASVSAELGTVALAGTYTWEIWAEDSVGVGGVITGSFQVLAYAPPTITGFEITRYTEILTEGVTTREEAEDGNLGWVDAVLNITPFNGRNAWTLAAALATDDGSAPTVAWQVTTGADGQIITLVRSDTVLGTRELDEGKDYTLTLTLTDRLRSASASAKAYKSDCVLNVERFGVAVGMLSSGTEQAPKLESAFPAHFYGGIRNFRTGTVEVSASLAAGSYRDAAVTFDPPFEPGTVPFVIVGFRTSSTAGAFGRCCAAVLTGSVTHEGCTLRCYNGDSSARNPSLDWIAFGTPAGPT